MDLIPGNKYRYSGEVINKPDEIVDVYLDRIEDDLAYIHFYDEHFTNYVVSLIELEYYNNFVKARYAGIPIFYNSYTQEIEGRNQFYEFLVDIIIWIDVNIFGFQGFKIDIEE